MRRSILRSALCLSVMLAPALASASDAPGRVSADLKDKDGNSAGKVTLTSMGDHLMGSIEAAGLAPGDHGMHIHAVGQCDAPDFTTAGGHLNPTGKKHGLDNPEGPHQGDLPALTAGADGKGKKDFASNSTIAAILDADGGAFVVHAGPDDQKSDPAGNSGPRVLCGVFKAG